MSSESYFATCASGLEPLAAQELESIGAEQVRPGRGGVEFHGDRSSLYLANLWLRTAIRVLKPVLQFHAGSGDELHDCVRQFDWSEYMTPAHTLAVDCNVRDSAVTHSRYAALRVKDAICDHFLDRAGRRPSVDVENPLIAFNLHLDHDEAVLSLDSSGESLHKRGYRPIQTRAPLNEALAAAILTLSGWTAELPLIDPMCGSGTFAIEASWMATHRPPGLTRRRFGFQGWLDFDVGLWTRLRAEARKRVLGRLPAPIMGSDAHRDSVQLAQQNARAAGVGHLLSFAVQDFSNLTAPEGPPGIILCNPPYGERLGQENELRGLYRSLGEALPKKWPGWRLCIFSGNQRLLEEVKLPIEAEFRLFNGRIPCKLVRYRAC